PAPRRRQLGLHLRQSALELGHLSAGLNAGALFQFLLPRGPEFGNVSGQSLRDDTVDVRQITPHLVNADWDAVKLLVDLCSPGLDNLTEVVNATAIEDFRQFGQRRVTG